VEQRIREALLAGTGWEVLAVERRPVDEPDKIRSCLRTL
jgi:hypothetical protein